MMKVNIFHRWSLLQPLLRLHVSHFVKTVLNNRERNKIRINSESCGLSCSSYTSLYYTYINPNPWCSGISVRAAAGGRGEQAWGGCRGGGLRRVEHRRPQRGAEEMIPLHRDVRFHIYIKKWCYSFSCRIRFSIAACVLGLLLYWRPQDYSY